MSQSSGAHHVSLETAYSPASRNQKRNSGRRKPLCQSMMATRYLSGQRGFAIVGLGYVGLSTMVRVRRDLVSCDRTGD